MKKYSILLLLFVTLVYTACESEINFPIEQLPPRLVVHGILETDSAFKVHLSASSNVTGNVVPNVLETAEVRIKDEDGNTFNLGLVEYDNQLSKYYKSIEGHKPVPGKRYFIEAENANLPSISGELLMPEVVEISLAKFSSDQFRVFERNPVNNPYLPYAFFLPVQLTINDQPGENFYELSVIQERLARYYLNEQGEMVFEPASFHRAEVFSNNPIVNSADLEDWEGLNGDNHRHGVLLFNDEAFDGTLFEVDMLALTTIQFGEDTTPFIDRIYNTRFHVELKHVSKEYYTYQETLRNYLENRHNNFVEPTNVYSNITNGLGVFLGNTSYKVVLDPQNPLHY